VVQVLHPRQQVEAEHRRHRHRDDQRGQRRDDEGDAQRHEQLAFQPRQREQRDEDQHDDDRGVQDGRAHLHRGVRDDLDRVQPAVRMVGAVGLQPPQHVLDTHHRVVDQAADGDGQAAQRHRVDRQAEVLEDQRGDEDRHRDGRQRDDGRPQGAQEEEQDHRHEDRGADQLALQRGDRGLDEAGLAEGHARRLHAGRQRRLQPHQRVLDGLRQRDGVGGRLLLDAQDHGRLAFEAGIAALERRGERHLGDLAQQDGLAVLEVSARFFRSSRREVRPRLRIRYSRPFSSRNPPEVLDE
jgi:hypothetical protein